MQKELTDFELQLKSYTEASFTIGVANATDGLEIAWLALGLKPGDEVICCSHTMLATAAAIKLSGGVPVPVEIGDDNLICPDAVEAAIGPRTVGIMPTQLNGRVCDMTRIMASAEKHNLFVVEDAAQALGARFKGQHAGTFGDASAISFFPAKVLGCFGDAGGVLTNDANLYDKMYQLHDHGRDPEGEVKSWGRNSRMDNVQAAILSYRLERYEAVIQRRRAIASLYQERLGFLKEAVKLPPAPGVDPDHFDVYQNYEMEADRRDELKAHLSNHGIGTLIQWGGKAVHQWERLGYSLALPKVERFFDRCIMLPMNVFITDDDCHYVCDRVTEFYRG
jgi:dTDP-4-amino-4,6-dideoxygalactose transaminase